MRIRPVNRYIQIEFEESEEEKESLGIILPDDYSPTIERYAVVIVVDYSDDVRFVNRLGTGTKLVVDRSMIEEIMVNKEKIIVIQDNYVIGIL